MYYLVIDQSNSAIRQLRTNRDDVCIMYSPPDKPFSIELHSRHRHIDKLVTEVGYTILASSDKPFTAQTNPELIL